MRLYYIPYFAIKEILLSMEITDLFSLSRCSKRARNVVKGHVRFENLSIKLDFSYVYHFSVMSPGKERPIGTFEVASKKKMIQNNLLSPVTIGRHRRVMSERRFSYGCNGFRTYWTDQLIGAKELFKELSDLFPIRISTVYLYLELVKNNHRSIVNWINKQDTELMNVYGDEYHWGDYMWLLEHIKTNELNFAVQPKEYYVQRTLKRTSTKVNICYGKWVKWHHLLAIDADMKIFKAEWTEQEVKQFLQRLRAGSNENMKRCSITFKNVLNFELCMEGLRAQRANVERWFIDLDNGDGFSIYYSPITRELFLYRS